MKNVLMKRYRGRMVGLAICMLFAANSQAQIDDGGCDPIDPACPIDGGISLLVAAGIAVGARKAYKEKKNNTVDL